MDTKAAAIELYGVPPEDFTAVRNRLAGEAKATGGADAAAAVKALRKPTLAAWLANQLVRADPDGVNELTELGDELRAAHLSGDRVRLRQLTPRRHDLVQSLVKTARAHAEAQGRRISDQVADRLAETLDAALVDPGAAQMLRTGQLTSALRHVGFGVVDESGEPAQLTALKPRVVRSARQMTPSSRSPSKKAPPAAIKPAAVDHTLERRRAELRARAEQAQAEYDEVEADRVTAESLLDANQHQVADLIATIDRLTQELDQARQQLRTAQRQTARLERAHDRAARIATVAKRRRDTNQQRLATFDS